MKDYETGSVWGQYDGIAIGGPAAEQKLRMDIIPTIQTTWANWLKIYPQTKVLTWYKQYEAEYSDVNYLSKVGVKLYPTGFESTIRNRQDTRLAENELVVGVNVGETFRAYPLADITAGLTVLPDTLDGQEIVLFIDPKTTYGAAYQPMINNEKLTFTVKEGVITDNQGNTWNLNGQAISGKLQGEKLPFVTSFITEWYGWTAYHPQTTIYGRK